MVELLWSSSLAEGYMTWHLGICVCTSPTEIVDLKSAQRRTFATDVYVTEGCLLNLPLISFTTSCTPWMEYLSTVYYSVTDVMSHRARFRCEELCVVVDPCDLEDLLPEDNHLQSGGTQIVNTHPYLVSSHVIMREILSN